MSTAIEARFWSKVHWASLPDGRPDESGRRRCRECQRSAERRYKAKRRAGLA